MFETIAPSTPAGEQANIRYRSWAMAPRQEPISRRRPVCVEVNDPGIPGADNWWCVNAAAARALALNLATQYGCGYRIVHDARPIRGWPHFHIVDPSGGRLSNHFFYGGRPPRRLYRDRPNREFESGADHFVVKALGGLIPAGHEVLTRRAAAGLRLSTAEVNALIEGVRRVDTVPLQMHFLPAQQKRHALRRQVCTRMASALSEIRNHLIALHGTALRAPSRIVALRWLGEALHLIQDSYSEAHTQREWRRSAPHPIRFIRFFGLSYPGPIEHQVVPPPDLRDLISVPFSSGLKPSATRAVIASNDYLKMALRQLGWPPSAATSLALRRFMNLHLLLSRTPREPRSLYPLCPP